MPWDLLLTISVTKMNLRPLEFWQMTFGEWYPIYNAVFGKEKPMSVNEAILLEEKWANGGN